MKRSGNLYEMLIKLYPAEFQKEFGEQMKQTCQDHRNDLIQQQGRVPLSFWISTLIDELKGATREHVDTLLHNREHRNQFIVRMVVATLLFLPLFVVIYGALVTLALSLPHPPLRGVGMLLALIGLLLGAGTLSGAGCHVLGSYISSWRCAKRA